MPQHTGRGRALACLVVGLLLGSASAFAQAVLRDARPARDSLTTLDLWMPEVVAAGSTASAGTARVVVHAQLQGLIDDLLSHSPAFRRQWQRLERFPRLGPVLDPSTPELRFLLGPWRWLVIVYAHREVGDLVAVIAFEDARSALSATTRRR